MRRSPPKKKKPELADARDYSGGLHILAPLPDVVQKAFEGIRIEGKYYLAFESSSVKIQRDFLMTGGRRIPRLRLALNPKVTVEIYGSHMEVPADRFVTHLVYNPSKFQLMCVEDFGAPVPLFATTIVPSEPLGWTVIGGQKAKLKGDALKTILQGVSDDPDLETAMKAVEEILDNPGDFMEEIPAPLKLEGEFQPVERIRVGEKLLDFIVPAIRSGDLRKLRLLEKCIRFHQTPSSNSKLDRIIKALLKGCSELGRVPTPPEIYSRMLDIGYQLKEARFYSDLADVGLGWLTRKKSSKTQVGP